MSRVHTRNTSVSPPSVGPRKRIALVIDSMIAPRRNMMNGVARFMQEHEPWSIYLKPPFVESEMIQWLDSWRGDGVIGRLTNAEAHALRAARIPLVEIAGSEIDDSFHRVRADDRAIGRLGAEHLLERGFKHFAFVDLPPAAWAGNRWEGFAQRLASAGLHADRHGLAKPSARPAGPHDYDRQQEALGEWIASLPKPVGIMTTNDFLGRQVLEACQRIGASVPDGVAVLGADNDEPICRISTPPLSSVIINDELRGYEAARVLAELMAGSTTPGTTVLIPPAGVQTRGSTDFFAFDDELMVGAMRHLRANAERVNTVDDLSRALGISRSTLDRRFRRVLGRSVNDEITRLRVEHSVRLLTETRLPLKTIATRCGFSSQSYMSTVFRTKLGRTPMSFRGAERAVAS